MVQLVGEKPLVTQLDFPLEAWHLLQPHVAASTRGRLVQPIGGDRLMAVISSNSDGQ